jgi:hypothetical protein
LAVNSIAELPPDPETTTRASPRGPLSALPDQAYFTSLPIRMAA